jgi:hypothetical protein
MDESDSPNPQSDALRIDPARVAVRIEEFIRSAVRL